MDGETPLYTWTTEYNNAGQMTLTIDPEGGSTTYAYDLIGRKTKVTAPNASVTELVYDALGRVITTKKGDTSGTSIVAQTTYDKMGNVVTREDGEGNQTTYTYDGFGRKVTVVDPLGHYTVSEYDDASLVTAVKRYNSGDTLLAHSTTEYDSLGRVTKARQKATPGGADGDDDSLIETVYDDEDRVLSKKVWVDTGTYNDTVYGYDGAGRQTKSTDPDGNDTTYEYDDDGRRTKVTDANSNDTTYEYDDDGRQTQVTNASGDYTVTAYDDRGLQTQVSRYASGDTLLARTKYEYDDAGRQTLSRRKADPGGSDSDTTDFVVKSYYDDGGVLTKRTSASGEDTTYAYDEYGRQTLNTLPDGSYSTSDYDDAGKVTKRIRYEIVGGNTLSYRHDYTVDALGRAVTTTNQGPDGTFDTGDDLNVQYVYDGAGRRVTTTDEAGKLAVTAYDALGRKTTVTEDAAGIARVTEFDYDRAGRMITLTAYTDSPSTGQQDTVYAYNGRGLQTIVTYEETGDVTMDYDAVGNMTKRTDEEAVVVDYAYDETNRLTDRRENGSSNDIETYTYDGLGRLVCAKKGTSANDDAVSESTFGYDALSRVTQESQEIAEGTAKPVNYTYDKAGNRITLQHDDGDITTAYAYDTRDRCTDINVYDNDDTEWIDLAEYTWLGNAISKRETVCDYPGATKPKFKNDFQRDGILRVTAMVNRHLTPDQDRTGPGGQCAGELGTFEYTYDTASNVLTADQTRSHLDPYRAVDRWYTYDTLNRLINAGLQDNQGWDTTTEVTTSYQYDDLGNRESHSYRDVAAIAYEHDKANRMTLYAGNTQFYDDAGNLTLAYSADRGTSYIYKYDHHNRLTAIWDGPTGTTDRKAAFTYDALGRRIEHVNDVLGETVRYYYDGVNEIVETDESAANQRTYVHGISYVDERLMMHDENTDRPYYYSIDRMYNVRVLVDRAGSIVERYCYDPYGRPLIRESCGRGKLRINDWMNSTDLATMSSAVNGTIWDVRGDMDDDGDVDEDDWDLFLVKYPTWWISAAPTVAQAFSDVGNPFMFQGRPHFALDTESDTTEGELLLNDHRARFSDVVIGRWNTRDPLWYNMRAAIMAPPRTSADRLSRSAPHHLMRPSWVQTTLRIRPQRHNEYHYMQSTPTVFADPTGLYEKKCRANCQSLGLAGTGSAASYCCREDWPGLVGPPACIKYSCYDPQMSLTTCPGTCTKEHEEARLPQFDCRYYSCACRGKDWSPQEEQDNHCAAYTAHYNCLTVGSCSSYPSNPGYVAFVSCVKNSVCDGGVPYEVARPLCRQADPSWDGSKD